ncbi:hypothetical protein [Bacillus haynesii]|uniref:hypothetical protein n=1 Tax=Bacillus haynesii TaxID=1925021 RepID=UPI001F6037C5|nr:hypothetical protein [Bacillus haynesii]MCI4126271.1 hypothetical protein [Bacillus haynesii]
MQVRKIKASDAESYLKLCETIDEESEFMLFEPGERKLQANGKSNRSNPACRKILFVRLTTEA